MTQDVRPASLPLLAAFVIVFAVGYAERKTGRFRGTLFATFLIGTAVPILAYMTCSFSHRL